MYLSAFDGLGPIFKAQLYWIVYLRRQYNLWRKGTALRVDIQNTDSTNVDIQLTTRININIQLTDSTNVNIQITDGTNVNIQITDSTNVNNQNTDRTNVDIVIFHGIVDVPDSHYFQSTNPTRQPTEGDCSRPL
jgi:hypothetical protein